MLAGLLAGWCFDKKNDIPIVGIFTYVFVVNAFSLVFDYDYSWAFLAFIEMLAGHGLYKMGFGNFLGELFSTSELKQKASKVVTASKVAKSVYNERSATRQGDESRRESKLQKLMGDYLGGLFYFYILLVILIFTASWIANLF
jgi:hypothetical protein